MLLYGNAPTGVSNGGRRWAQKEETMTRSDCHGRDAGLAGPLSDLAFMLSCYDVYSAPPPVGCPEPLAEAQRLLGHQGDGT
jgi:hypothetical protein